MSRRRRNNATTSFDLGWECSAWDGEFMGLLEMQWDRSRWTGGGKSPRRKALIGQLEQTPISK